MQAAGKGDGSQIERHEIRCHVGHKRAEIIAVEHLGAAKRGDFERVARRYGVRTEAITCEQHRLASLSQQMA